MGINSTKLAKTNARVPASIVIQIRKGSGSAVKIGAVTGMTVRMSRRLTRRFELDTDIPGSSVEIVPGTLQDLSLSIKRAMLYNAAGGGDFIEYLKENGIYSAYDILAQKFPFEIVEKRYNPSDTSDSGENFKEITYYGCMVESMPYDYEITGDWLIIQDVSIWASGVKYS